MTAPLNNNKLTTSKLFIITGLLLMATGMLFGLTGALQYLVPGFLKKYLSFEIIRPLHVSSVIFWIIFAAMGAVLTYLQEYTGRKIFYPMLLKIQLAIFTVSVLTILISYCFGVFGGREYWEFHPLLALPIATGWILFIINFVRSIGSFKKQPVYVWMWLTGLFFFLFTFIESYLWIFPYFSSNVVNDMTVQWKSYGSMVGAWNMLIYGSSIFLMEKISGNKKYSHAPIAFLLYFTGLFNLMFNWGHHIYTLPTYPFIKYISYAVSMTELFILGRIIWQWKSSVSTARKHYHHTAYRFIMAADIWIFLTLLLAIAMSVPAINVYTHGTHITVAHTMGATIGINSFLLLAIAFDILHDTCIPLSQNIKWLNRGYLTANISLLIFWISLIAAGILKARWQMSDTRIPFSSMMLQLRPCFIIFFISGFSMITGFLFILYPLLKNQAVCYFRKIIQKRKLNQEQLPGNLVME
ncbi:MAG: cbb3-type cytochrome c oxidase subunit I [Chitinophagaceae bacterium]|nr:cbb3-type cytochrome c oxidase subunit I [Candidatus Brachybacter algidus]MBK6378251.1 cbb3-type cytochrome c oxidase subunit I [Chitinophagaceae bacterium]MBK8749278.1 cbb3-type cytochrome c oxidase subunit I [Candidatus Brachybacter algidus]MBL0305702.1 cbb3-type cytochrome c oxidase subunit I [Chitinophagaceae bacterium]HQW43705.1 cbb3-type cytochrome c oxidase subunit I [Chitinophagaceae bacterium]